MNRILCFDPSGNFSKGEGKGTTGWALFENDKLTDFGAIKSSDYESIEEYWQEHLILMYNAKPDKIICESYRLQGGKQMQQTWSALETPQLIGAMRMASYTDNKPFILQDPTIKARVADEMLARWGIIQSVGSNRYNCMDRLTNLHQRDAIRHGVFYIKYRKQVG